MRSLVRHSLLLYLAVLAGGCLSGNYTRNLRNLSVLKRARAELPQNGVDLSRCLEILGAPTLVFEHEVHGLQLVYAWEQRLQWGASVSVPAGDSTSASFNYASIRQRQEGVVLWLDAEWQLIRWEHGYLRALIGSEPRPATLEQLEES